LECWSTGMMEYWVFDPTHHSSIPSLQYSSS
jgi:hypothetical protein